MSRYFDLSGRSALVTGDAGGIGSAVAEALADAGAAVLVTDLDKDAAAAVAETISGSGGRAASALWMSRIAHRPMQRPRRRPRLPMASCTS